MSALPRTAAALLIVSFALLGGAATASAHPSAPRAAHQPTDDDFTIHYEVNVSSFGDMVLD